MHSSPYPAIVLAMLVWTGAAHADPGATPLPTLTPPSVSSPPPSVSPSPPGVSPAPPAFAPRTVVRRRACRKVRQTDIFGRPREVTLCGSERF
jgi:hypothetical protein